MSAIPAHVSRVLHAVLIATMLNAAAAAQTSTEAPAANKASRPDPSTFPTRTFVLHHADQVNDGNELLTGLRLMLDPSARLYLVPFQQLIIVRAAPDQIKLAETLLAEMDKPRKSFRATYTITERDGTRVVGVQHFSMDLVTGNRTTLKSGSKVPIVTGSINQDNQTQNQMTYLDVGLNFDATVESSEDFIRLNSKVEQSSIAEEKSGVGPQDPVVRQTLLQGASLVTPGKPIVLGSLDTPGSTRHLDIEVVLEPAK